METLHNETLTVLDVTQLEKEARRMRAAYIQAGVHKAWTALVAYFGHAAGAQDHGASKA
ncbi:RSP_7527 family protein [Roseinatronobacter alkalisoli]|uniref:Uncharacterized protein n=1 Tax=Roseinatronobacter alkalisoli TaxID=3028235 RepID=A0ABT5T7V9_9RHOB|nr:hypothetical protein [Roseinatronobacter sp. HJB301]MDD7971217.1 hypothetical protein [Roseinatronobacter sp. HJB301]